MGMSIDDPLGTDWAEHEVDLIVADYFDMLRMEIASEPYVKAHRNAALQRLIGRSRGSIEFKHQNISAVLIKLGMPWISGYKPLMNFQKSLIDGIERYLDDRDDPFAEKLTVSALGFSESSDLYFEPPPALAMAGSSTDHPVLERLVRKFDPAERDVRNRSLNLALPIMASLPQI